MTPITTDRIIATIADALKESGARNYSEDYVRQCLLEYYNEQRTEPTALPAWFGRQGAANAIAQVIADEQAYLTADFYEEVHDRALSLIGWQLPKYGLVIFKRDDKFVVWLGNDLDYDGEYLAEAELP
jgi:hypothetical protein